MLTQDQETILLAKIESLRTIPSVKVALHRNDALFKFLNALNAFGFISPEKYQELDERRFCALMKIEYKGAKK